MSATLIAFPLLAEPWAWALLRVLFGFFMSGVYVTAESWLNNDSSNELRGKVLSAYMLAQMIGMVAAQWLATTADATAATLFILASILVSLSFGPILLAATSTPAAETSKPMSLYQLYSNSPLATVGLFLLGGVFGAQSGMGAVYGTQAGLSTNGIALFVAAMFLGGLVLQYPVGWLSDRMDRRRLILLLTALGSMICGLGFVAGEMLLPLLVAAFPMGGMANPLDSLLIAYINDYLHADDMPAASGGLVFTYGLGAIFGPLVIGAVMEVAGAQAFWLVLAALFGLMTLYGLWRIPQRRAPPVEELAPYVGVMPASTPLAVETAQAWSNELQERSAIDEKATRD